MKISITRKQKEYEIIIDDEDYNKIKDLKLRITTDYKYKKSVVESRSGRRLHRFIIPSKSNQICIHKNNNPFDFRKDNLFITTQKELMESLKNGTIQPRYDEFDRLYYVSIEW